MSKHSVQINNELYSDILEFCKANKEKISIFCERILKDGLLREKYGDTPFGMVTHEINMPPIISDDKKDLIKPHIENMVNDYTIAINHKIIDEITQPEIIELPLKLEPVTKTIITGRDNISEKYEKKVPKEYYGEIKVEEPKKKKTRRL